MTDYNEMDNYTLAVVFENIMLHGGTPPASLVTQIASRLARTTAELDNRLAGIIYGKSPFVMAVRECRIAHPEWSLEQCRDHCYAIRKSIEAQSGNTEK